MDVSARYAAAWERELQQGLPTRVRTVCQVGWEALRRNVQEASEDYVAAIVASLARGDLWVVRHVFEREFMDTLRDRTIAWTKSREPAFHKMLDGCPDFHRVIDAETGSRYAFPCCKHSAYFYRWNDDPLGIWPAITARWRIFKILMGLAEDAYERNVPSDGVVDRIQVVRYPPSIGFLAPHQDPHEHQRLFFSAYMSKRGVDYHGGGFYALGADNQVQDIEALVDVGDVCVGMASIVHGVEACDADRPADWSAGDGRWFLSMYSNASDAVPERVTGRPAELGEVAA